MSIIENVCTAIFEAWQIWEFHPLDILYLIELMAAVLDHCWHQFLVSFNSLIIDNRRKIMPSSLKQAHNFANKTNVLIKIRSKKATIENYLAIRTVTNLFFLNRIIFISKYRFIVFSVFYTWICNEMNGKEEKICMSIKIRENWCLSYPFITVNRDVCSLFH